MVKHQELVNLPSQSFPCLSSPWPCPYIVSVQKDEKDACLFSRAKARKKCAQGNLRKHCSTLDTLKPHLSWKLWPSFLNHCYHFSSNSIALSSIGDIFISCGCCDKLPQILGLKHPTNLLFSTCRRAKSPDWFHWPILRGWLCHIPSEDLRGESVLAFSSCWELPYSWLMALSSISKVSNVEIVPRHLLVEGKFTQVSS